ncbi:MAG: glucosaminidase domain-containing protein [Granulosicoccus sp.]|nr:glucosaminidase domain-containing protein [Granulosicoccus sp.]
MDTPGLMSIVSQTAAFRSVPVQSDTTPTITTSTPESDDKASSFTTHLYSAVAEHEKNTQPLLKLPVQRAEDSQTRNGSLAFMNRLWDLMPSSDSIDSSSKENFVRSLIGSARRAGFQLGVDSSAVIAVAALETGWGKHVIQTDNGQSSNNLFGIKATRANLNSATTALTSEYIDGVEHKLHEPFRTYQSPADSVSDFARFLSVNPRYSGALSQAYDANAFIEKIHEAGYATDPNYAAKVKSVMVQVEKIINADPSMTMN